MYPALAVHSALMNDRTAVETLWVGGEGGMESALVQRAGIPFRAIPAAGLHGVGLKNLPRNLGLMVRGVGASRRILHEFRPGVMLFTGTGIVPPDDFTLAEGDTVRIRIDPIGELVNTVRVVGKREGVSAL